MSIKANDQTSGDVCKRHSARCDKGKSVARICVLRSWTYLVLLFRFSSCMPVQTKQAWAGRLVLLAFGEQFGAKTGAEQPKWQDTESFDKSSKTIDSE